MRGRTGVDVPFVAVDAQCDVNLDVLDAATPFRDFPGELVVCVPGRAHTIIEHGSIHQYVTL